MITHVSSRNSERGIALMIVMMVVFVLTAIVGGLAYTMKVETRLAQNYDNDIEMEFLGRSGIELARYVLNEKDKIPGQQNVEALNQKWAGWSGASMDGATNDLLSNISLTDVPIGNGIVSVKIVDLERKFDINYAANPQAPMLPILQNAYTVMGMPDATLGSSATDAILDWIDPDESKHLGGAESDYYKDLGYLSKNANIDDMSELLLMKGIWDHPELYYGGQATNHSVTAFQQRIGGQGFDARYQPPPLLCGLNDLFCAGTGALKVNLNTVDEKVLQLLPGIDQFTAQNIIGQRTREGIPVPFQSVQEAIANIPSLNPIARSSLEQYCGVRSFNFDVEVEIRIGDYTRKFYGTLRRAGRDFQLIKFYWD